MPPQRPHDPFNDAPRRPTSRTTHHLQETQSSHALRPTNPSSTRNLFAPTSRRPAAVTSAAAGAATAAAASSTHVNEVLEDSDEGQSGRVGRRPAAATAVTAAAGATTRGGVRTRRARVATETTVEPDEDVEVGGGEFVIRDKAGDYLREVPAIGKAEVGLDEEQLAEDARLTAITRDFWASGGGTSGRSSRLIDEEDLKPKADMMARLREAVDKKLTEEKWMYEPTDYLEELRIRNHGV